MRSFPPRALAAVLLVPACATEPTRFVAGPEDPTLLEGLTGSFLVREIDAAPIDREIQRYTLPDRRHRTWKLDHGATNFSGPDEEGRIVYNVDDHGFYLSSTQVIPATHDIRVAWVDGRTEEILVHEDGLLWGGDVLALSPSGGWVAYLQSHFGGQQLLTVFRIGESAKWHRDLGTKPAGGLHWLNDGKLLLRTGSMDWKDTPPEFRPAEPEPSWNGDPAAVPLVFLLDVETGKERILCRGVRPLPTAGQSLAVLACDETGYFTVDAETRERLRPGRPLPGALERGSYVIGALDADRVLYLARPTEGTKVRTYYDPYKCAYCARPTVKVADLTRGTFATVVQNVMPPIASYGR